MPFDTGILAIALAALSFCGAMGCILALIRTRHALVTQQKEVSAQLSELHQKLAELAPAPAPTPQVVSSINAIAEPEEEQDELLAAVTAAAAAIADRKARIRSIQQVHPEPEATSAWSQQGRVVVQSSHNIGPHR
jgi:peptidoglycan hydrolase CwlO-like protein